MKRLILFVCAITFISLGSNAKAAESSYEVYYFYASWRCTNCTNAEKWSNEAVAMIKASNPSIKVSFIPKQLEKNKELVSKTKAKRVDLVVAEIQNGKMVRFDNVGNLLNVVGSKPILMKAVVDGIMTFDAKSSGGGKLQRPEDYAMLEQRASQPPSKVLVYIVMKDAADSEPPRVTDVIDNVLSTSYIPQLQEQAIIANIVDADIPQNKNVLDMFNAGHGDVVVALIQNNAIANFATIPWPKTPQDDIAFTTSFSSALSQNLQLGGL